MSDSQHSVSSGSAREQELEIEVARLQAELDTLRGEEPTVAASRFLAMAAATVDRAVEEARREADEIIEEISAQAEARRDEATRVAAEAEAMAEQLLAEADRAQERIDAATEEAEAIRRAAEAEAEELINAERAKVAAEIEALAEVRSALEDERGSLESYHEALRAKVQELAASMVSFMTTELPVGAAAAIENLVAPQLATVGFERPSLDVAESDIAEPVSAPTDDNHHEVDDAVPVDVDPDVSPADVVEAVEDAADPWGALLEAAIPANEAYPETVGLSDDDGEDVLDEDALDEAPEGFAGHEVVEPVTDGLAPRSTSSGSSAGLFSRATPTEAGFEDLSDDSDIDSDDGKPGLFGMLESRLVQQTSPEVLADALGTEDADDEAFQNFLTGDDEPDPSRDWLLRPDQR